MRMLLGIAACILFALSFLWMSVDYPSWSEFGWLIVMVFGLAIGGYVFIFHPGQDSP